MKGCEQKRSDVKLVWGKEKSNEGYIKKAGTMFM